LFISQYFFTKANPNPLPSYFRVYPVSSCSNVPNNFGRNSFEMPMPVSSKTTVTDELSLLKTLIFIPPL